MEYDYNDMGDNMDNSSQPSLEQMGSLSNQVDLVHNNLELLDAKISLFHLDVKMALLLFFFS
jgi:hypothetical protein